MLPVLKKHQIVSEGTQRFLDFGAERHRVFVPLDEKGVLTKPISRGNLYFGELKDEPLPREAVRILNEVQYAPVPVKQFVIGHEYPIVKYRPRPKINKDELVKFTLAAMGAVALTIGYVMYTTAMASLMVIDPCLVGILNDGSETWILLAEWDE